MKMSFVFLLSCSAFGQSLFVSVTTTNTQAILSYIAPSSSPCSVEVSESKTFTPLVHDVDPALFAGAGSDSRTGSLTGDTSRLFISGKRSVETALDGKNYSRALQAYTMHYYRVTCGTVVAAGSFMTKNIALGMTYSDMPLNEIPTIELSDRNQRIIDPHTGALIKRVSLFKDSVSPYSGTNGPYMTDGGFNRMCGYNLIGPGPGYLCAFPNGAGAMPLLYYIIPSSGEVRFLGIFRPPGCLGGCVYPTVNTVDDKFYAQSNSGSLLQIAYSGDFSSVAQGADAPVSVTLLSSLTPVQLLQAYDPTFPTYGGCSFSAAGQYGLLVCKKANQDSYGSMAVMDLGNRLPMVSCGRDPAQCPRIIAISRTSEAAPTRWCGLHTTVMVAPFPVVFQSFHGLTGVTKAAGYGTYETTLTAPLAGGDTGVQVAGEPLNLGAPDEHWIDAAVGDWIVLGSGGNSETVKITAKADSTHWTVSRSKPNSYTAGTRAVAMCPGSWNAMWKFLEDPTGTDTTNTKLVMSGVGGSDWPLGGHDDWNTNIRLTEKYLAIKGPFMDHLGDPINFKLASSPAFAGVTGKQFGNSYQGHPSLHQLTDQTWFTDMTPFFGDRSLFNGAGTLMTGQLWKFTMTTGPSWNRKVLPTFATSDNRMLTDISGPGSYIPSDSSGANKYCVVEAAGECYANSVAGEVYVNVANSSGACRPVPVVPNDICFGMFAAWGSGAIQLGLTDTTDGTVSMQGQYGRRITDGMAPFYRGGMFEYATFKSLPDASWGLIGWRTFDLWDTGHKPAWTKQQTNAVFLVKLPPFAAQDPVDRSTFIRTPVSITVPQDQGIASATVEFGYAEYGDPSQHYCTSRRDACVAVGSTAGDANPFNWKAADSYSRTSCPDSCTITLPVLPMHVAYWQVRFYSSAGTFVADGPSGVTAEGAVFAAGMSLRQRRPYTVRR